LEGADADKGKKAMIRPTILIVIALSVPMFLQAQLPSPPPEVAVTLPGVTILPMISLFRMEREAFRASPTGSRLDFGRT